MRILFDTNVVLDVLLDRKPHAEVATKLFNLVDRGKMDGVICATTVTTIHYLATKAVGKRQAQKHLHELLTMFEVAAVDRDVLTQALALGFADFEDAVLHEAGRAAGASGIVTRNLKDFVGAEMPVLAPEELLSAAVAAS